MPKANLKTKLNDGSVKAFLNSIDDDEQRLDSFKMCEIMTRLSGDEPKMWGTAIVGFGLRTLKYPSGRELDWMVTGFSPRKGTLTLYILDGSKNADKMMARLGKHKTGKGCLYIKKLSDIDESVLEKLISASLDRKR